MLKLYGVFLMRTSMLNNSNADVVQETPPE